MRRLTAKFVERLRRPGTYPDENGLRFRLRRSGRRYWEQRVDTDAGRRDLGIGPYPVVGLAEARAIALDNLVLLKAGDHPILHGVRPRSPSFAEAARAVRDLNVSGWKNARTPEIWYRSLELHALRHIGSRPVGEIDTADLMSVVGPIWTSRPALAENVRRRIGTVMKWAILRKYRRDNPAQDVLGALPRSASAPRRHHRALPHAEVATAIATVWSSPARLSTKLAFEFLVLTAARSGEVRGARWREIDFDGAVWTVPADRMKAGLEHRVPLSARALDILREAEVALPDSELVFPSKRGKPIAQNTHATLLRELGIGAVPHGFRSSFRDWCGETGVDREVAERCLAHAVGGAVEQAYARSDLLDRRGKVMEDWARYLAPDCVVAGAALPGPC